MKVIIDIDEKLYKIIKDPKQLATMVHASRCAEAVENGIPIPKGHGRIADIDKMLEEMRVTRTYDILFALERVKPIIKADKEE
jgi:hypothetical protein